MNLHVKWNSYSISLMLHKNLNTQYVYMTKFRNITKLITGMGVNNVSLTEHWKNIRNGIK